MSYEHNVDRMLAPVTFDSCDLDRTVRRIDAVNSHRTHSWRPLALRLEAAISHRPPAKGGSEYGPLLMCMLR